MSLDITIPRWNSPEDLPDADTTVLIRTTDDDTPIWPGFWDGECWRFADATRVLEVITGWMDIGTAADALDEMSADEKRLLGDPRE